MRRWGVVPAAVLCLAFLGCGGSRKGEGTVLEPFDMLDLLKALPAATVKCPHPEYVKLIEMTVGNQARQTLFMHPDSQVEYPALKITDGSWLEFGVGINQEAWDKAGDGVQFTVLVRTADKKERQIFSRYVDPKNNVADRCWLNFEVPLKAFAGQEVHLLLMTTSGPAKNPTYDWAGWSGPRLFLHRG